MSGKAVSLFYNTFFKRNSTYVGFVLGGAFLGEMYYDYVTDSVWESLNKGKLFKDVKTGVPGGDDDDE